MQRSIDDTGKGKGLDALIRLIERVIQAVVTGIQPLVENGNLGYLIPFLLLLGATLIAVSSRNRMSLAGYLVGWVIAIAIIGLYTESNGDTLLANLTGTVPRTDLFTPAFLGLIFGFFLIIPFSRWRMSDSQPIMMTIVTAIAVILLFLTYRVSNSFSIVHTGGEEILIAYRKRYIGVFSLTFGLSVILLVLLTAGNPPRSYMPPPYPPGDQDYM